MNRVNLDTNKGTPVSITSLQLTHFRNLTSVSLSCAPRFNLFFGNNGAGKTALLEAIYYLSCGKSFRTSQIDRIIHHDSSEFIVFSTFNDCGKLGIQKNREHSPVVRYNTETVKSVATISQFLPVQFIGTSSHRILIDGPKVRRQFLDWGLFYTYPHFYPQWRDYQRVLEHRNAALKARLTHNELTTWNQQIAAIGEAISSLRKNYLIEFLPYFNKIISVLLPDSHIDIQYSQGWRPDSTLLDCLKNNVSRETLFGYSLYGPHRADLLITADNKPAQEVLSQGQQKLISHALRLAQGLFFEKITGKAPIYLIDDMPSELDGEKRLLVIRVLHDMKAQVFLTAIDQKELLGLHDFDVSSKMFHVKHGDIVECH